MTLKDFNRWNIRFSLVYAAGIWVMITGYGYYYIKKKKKDAVTSHLQQDSLDEMQDTAVISTQAEERRPGLHIKNAVVFKDDFVPYSRRIYSLVSPLFTTTPAAPGSDSPDK
ncbi:hypothetical protein XENTR_v10013571 [Xenopus tropicalis]|uniref:Uncharacterized protein LOC100491233 n=1 Tax=Xenopus tropicalis TaxID=8364 RepID=A0A8J0QTT0_XENTR|nr:uncharacterized protein LOC100491233 [Xenopus tropicalis]KAE8601184.1 hypothetical protein XENTR_v10013571 [Xenopus tropicalis]|eukprot:XP_002940141.1 PREDICTED: uncharacterized protein LOC100491233 [Xenopus tropicalis]